MTLIYLCRVELADLSKYRITTFDPGVVPFVLIFPEDTDLENHPQEKNTQLSQHLFSQLMPLLHISVKLSQQDK